MEHGFYPDPNKQANEILFSCKKKPIHHPDLIFNGVPVTRVTEHKHLGLTVQPSLTFVKHINEKIKKAKARKQAKKEILQYSDFRPLVLSLFDQILFISKVSFFCKSLFIWACCSKVFLYNFGCRTFVGNLKLMKHLK